MSAPVTYKKQRVNIVLVVIVLVLGGAGYLAYLYLPIKLRESEVMRVLDETSSEFTGKAPRMLEVPEEVRNLQRKMIGDLQAVGVEDPNAEYWIEIDTDDEVRFGVLYSDWIKLPFREPDERVHELEMRCARAGRGSSWTCVAHNLQAEGTDGIPQAP